MPSYRLINPSRYLLYTNFKNNNDMRLPKMSNRLKATNINWKRTFPLLPAVVVPECRAS